MANKISKYIKLDKNILVEYIYDDSNLISTPYQLLINTKDNISSYVSGSDGTMNSNRNQLIPIDKIIGKYGKLSDIGEYPFLQEKDYGNTMPLRHDTINIHLPTNYNFGEYLGMYLRVYTHDITNDTRVDLSNFYFDITDIDSLSDLQFNAPPLYFQETFWGKRLSVNIPSMYEISRQKTNFSPTPNSLNYYLSNGRGLSDSSPIFMEFYFIKKANVINGVKTYLIGNQTVASVPQSPEFEGLSLMIEHSQNGDFFEIYGTYKDSITEFKRFIDDSVYTGNRYHVQYNITIYEQNIRGKSLNVYLSDNFTDKVEYRPIIKYSTTTAIIDVEMKLIDINDGSMITRRASRGLLQDEVSKYSLKMIKINLENANKPKIYNIIGSDNITNNINNRVNRSQLQIVKVPYPVMIESHKVVAKTENIMYGSEYFYGIGQMKLMLYPFDNIVKIILADKIDTNKVNYLDLSSSNAVNMIFKDGTSDITIPLYEESGEVNLQSGVLVFNISSDVIPTLTKIYNSGKNLFYITSSSNSITTSIYSGLFQIYDSKDNVDDLDFNQIEIENQVIVDDYLGQSTIDGDGDGDNSGESAIVTIKTIERR